VKSTVSRPLKFLSDIDSGPKHSLLCDPLMNEKDEQSLIQDSTRLDENRVICSNCFRSGHSSVICNFMLATVIEESPQKLLQGLEGGVAAHCEDANQLLLNEFLYTCQFDRLCSSKTIGLQTLVHHVVQIQIDTVHTTTYSAIHVFNRCVCQNLCSEYYKLVAANPSFTDLLKLLLIRTVQFCYYNSVYNKFLECMV
jgi:hypothetical protein